MIDVFVASQISMLASAIVQPSKGIVSESLVL
jgi:hypothetical protein